MHLQGIKPQSLSRVDDPQVRQFIEKCLLPASSRPTAFELSMDPFLARDGGKDSALVASSSTASKPVRPPQLEHLPMDVDHNENKSVSICSSRKSNEEYPWSQTIELQRFAENKEFRLRGERSDDITASMLLRIADSSGLFFEKMIVYPIHSSRSFHLLTQLNVLIQVKEESYTLHSFSIQTQQQQSLRKWLRNCI